MKNRKIKLKEIRHNKSTLSKALKISDRETLEWMDHIRGNMTPLQLIQHLGFTEEEISGTAEEMLYKNKKPTEAISNLWLRKGEQTKEISIEDCISTYLLLMNALICKLKHQHQVVTTVPLLLRNWEEKIDYIS